ncbi:MULTISPECIES: bifunctional demethylmenaquinone methyltransferase/2-methoxy-6-polyprenyl-1,4-benzoquinol methylase UbiE [Culturomica]|jgi:demethylmenaquinone methyltransferase/2-methoxy-6-polyprenyl-1,4-benzoquinol methylase|uniref:bifunctional demethylmenaquinone methyltransferase/2-methoxy-6-polyprenyl-1,4-benzoquinol methylase UbiE n=2 Tax=Odoribacteraceae TaxID=1853231 RepID=UPI00033CD2BA|nr:MULTISPECIES: bifunctional demethylmenaquinone methyltransferase/2-methoxy-6-polyprenyl-1,4-benzoquinol methylase UbiE [Odoribacteraceae]RHV96144.1 bifunctional demethylmenaquinone methyltransferase/2-methoxy-6-polyprenyl-1,4-benzoquinol methylase UbiE [Odoribacter sp. OF09-27XD]CCZ06843.1 demethylmenaquinone methyltransferase [Odoribacter sp. CAG:788]HBO25745.1 bifunctional demethylmenaquinone methyltransferase/2-methoxy-6-polyprenyl-1,4-benzoquinol methylase UbiE [Culturomica sp.]
MAKKEAVQGIFNDIAPSYDRLNHFLSLNIDKKWRRKAIRCLQGNDKGKLLDVACGTGDFSIAASQAGVSRIIGIDISEKMLEIGRKKVEAAGLAAKIDLRYGDSERMEFADETFDAVTVAFGVRNFEHLEIGLKEMYRVLKQEGKVVILEFSMPRYFPMRQLYRFYFRHILPLVGGWISGNKGAYVYLPESVSRFPQGNDFLQILSVCGFKRTFQKRLTFGVASLYVGYK